jgi:hypothetical protein
MALWRWLRPLTHQGLTLAGHGAAGAIADWHFLVLRQTGNPGLTDYQQMVFLG